MLWLLAWLVGYLGPPVDSEHSGVVLSQTNIGKSLTKQRVCDVGHETLREQTEKQEQESGSS
jgi:hypothetical protein